MNEYRIGTKCVQGGYTPGNGEPRQIPIVQSTTFKYATSEDMGKLFDLEASGYFYSRLQKGIFIHVFRIRLMIWLRQRLQRWKVERQRC